MGFLGNNEVQNDFFDEKKAELNFYESESGAVENEIALAIQSLEQINTGIDKSLEEIAVKKAELDETEKKLSDMKTKNVSTIEKYESLFSKVNAGGVDKK